MARQNNLKKASEAQENQQVVEIVSPVVGDTKDTPQKPVAEAPVKEKKEYVSPKLEIDSGVDTTKKPEERVKIRLRQDHRCSIAMEHYDFKAGKVYLVPRNVKSILNRAGLLSPL